MPTFIWLRWVFLLLSFHVKIDLEIKTLQTPINHLGVLKNILLSKQHYFEVIELGLYPKIVPQVVWEFSIVTGVSQHIIETLR